MLKHDYRDMAGGGILLLCGGFMAINAMANYELGTLQRMGPGMFPLGLGLLMAGFGVALGVMAWFRSGPMPDIRIWSPLFVLLGIAGFALAVRPLGLIPAILAVTIISSFAELKVRPLSLAILCLVLCVMAWLVFRVALGLPLVMIRWPF